MLQVRWRTFKEFIMLDFDQSIELIKSLPKSHKGDENIFLTQANGRILSEDIIAFENAPEFVTAAMDGYAIVYGAMESDLEIIGDNPAGSGVALLESEACCIKTFTGSLMPQGSDTLVPIENVEVIENKIRVIHKVPKGFATREVGEIYQKGEVLLSKGTQLGYAEIGVMASLNIAYVKVRQKPKVAIISSGSEILDIAQLQTNPSQIRSSNHIALEILAQDMGVSVLQMGVVSDDKCNLTQAIVNALHSSDIVVTTGGVSVGDYDFTKEVLEKLGAKVLFHGVKIKPGQHILVAQIDDKFILCLPGFAYSAMVTFVLYMQPLLEKFGHRVDFKVVEAKMMEDVQTQGSKKTFIAVNIDYIEGEYRVDLKGKKSGSSAILTNMLSDAALLMVDEGVKQINAGEFCKVILLN